MKKDAEEKGEEKTRDGSSLINVVLRTSCVLMVSLEYTE